MNCQFLDSNIISYLNFVLNMQRLNRLNSSSEDAFDWRISIVVVSNPPPGLILIFNLKHNNYACLFSSSSNFLCWLLIPPSYIGIYIVDLLTPVDDLFLTHLFLFIFSTLWLIPHRPVF